MHVNAPSSIIGPLKPCTKHVHSRRTTILPCKPRARDKSQTGVTSATIEREPTQTHECMNTSQNQDNSEQSVHNVTMERTPIAPYKSCPRRTRRDESTKTKTLQYATQVGNSENDMQGGTGTGAATGTAGTATHATVVLRPPRPTTQDSHQEFKIRRCANYQAPK